MDRTSIQGIVQNHRATMANAFRKTCSPRRLFFGDEDSGPLLQSQSSALNGQGDGGGSGASGDLVLLNHAELIDA